MDRIVVDKSDKDRAILTDALPYEVPIIFSNEGLYRHIKTTGLDSGCDGICSDAKSVINNLLSPKKKYTIPFEYMISNKLGSNRRLSVIHPKSQIDVARLYAKFDHQILHLCTLSPSSLRFPSSIATHFYEKSLSGDESKCITPGVEVEEADGISKIRHASSYFSYNKYGFLYKFYDSYEFIKLEKRFHYLTVFDVAKCFSSIYTHSISWAVKDKEFSKEHKDTYSFESEFDKFMQNSNYNETNGIVIGPEISRVFAEVILQRIDRDSIKIIHDKLRLVHDRDYAVRRYIDDYFIFAKNEIDKRKIFDVIVANLEGYKLYINSSKTQEYVVPYATKLTITRMRLYEYLSNEMDRVYDKKDNKLNFNNPRVNSKRWINQIKATIRSCDSDYYGVSSLVLSLLRGLLVSVLDKNQECEIELQRVIKNLIDVVLDVVFFVYSMDARVRTTYVVSQIIVTINHGISGYMEELAADIRKTIFDNSVHMIIDSMYCGELFTPERQNLLIAISELGEQFLLPENLLAKISGFTWDGSEKKYKLESSNDYFQIISLLFYMKNHQQYSDLNSAVVEYSVEKLGSCENLHIRSECVMLLLDIISCPYVDTSSKQKLAGIAVSAAGGSKINRNGINNDVLAFCQSREWFTSWKSFINIRHLLEKKELRVPYD